MRKLLLFLVMLFSIAFSSWAQPLTGYKTIPTGVNSYPSIAAAVADLNAQGVGAGGVTFGIEPGYIETISQKIRITATGTAANPIIFMKSDFGVNPMIKTGFSGNKWAKSADSLDGIVQLIGSDYVTFNGIDLLDTNSTRTLRIRAMEYGYGFFKSDSTNGCQYNTIKNCNVTLSNINDTIGATGIMQGSCGIAMYNVSYKSTTALNIIAVSGTNSYNTFYTNTIQGAWVGIGISGYIAASSSSLGCDRGNDIGGTSLTTGNSIINIGGLSNGTNANAVVGIFMRDQWDYNISYNTINNNTGSWTNPTAPLRAINVSSGGLGANGTISNNTVTLKSGATTNEVTCIYQQAGSTAASNTIRIFNNLITNCTNDLATTSIWYGIYNTGAPTNLSIMNNTFSNNTTKATSGATYLIYNSGAVPGKDSICNNNLSFSHINTAAYTGTIYSVYNGSGTTATNLVISNNNFSNYSFTTTGTGVIYFVYNTNGSSTNRIEYNTWTNLILKHSGTQYMMYNSTITQVALNVNYNSIVTGYKRMGASGTFYIYYSGSSSLGTSTQTFSYNNFSNITSDTTGTGTFYGIYTSDGSPTPYPKKTFFNNTFSNIFYNTTGTAYMMYMSYLGDGTTTSGSTIYNNTISNVTTASTTFYVMYPTATVSPTYKPIIYGNTIHNVKTNGATGTIYGCYLGAGVVGVDFYNNKISKVTSSSTGTTGAAYGLYTLSANPYNIYNNYIQEIYNARGINATVAAAGIYLSTGTTINLYNNTVYLDNASDSTKSITAALYATSTPTSIDVRNNIFVNNSTFPIPSSTAKAIAYQRNNTTIANFAALSNNNCFYAGNPDTNRLVFFDGTNKKQTIADYQAFVTPREAASFSALPPFVSVATTPYNLHIQSGVNTKCESGGSVITTPNIISDYDGDPRYPNSGYPEDVSAPASSPDVGADEFAGLPSFTCNNPDPGNTLSSANSLCLGQTITLTVENPTIGTGVTYQWQSSANGSSFTNISGAINSFYTVAPVASVFYRCIVSCQNGPVSATSNPIQIDFMSNITSTTAASRCGTGTVNLSASGTGTSISWFTAASAFVGSGSPFTTPVINSTTSYYASSTIIAAGNASVGAGATTSATYSNPFYSAWSNTHTQHLITAAELINAGISPGNINSVALDVTSAGTLPMIDLSVKIGTTMASNMSFFANNSGFSTVYTNASLLPIVGLNVLTFTSPFNWDGVSNIVLEFCHGNAASTATMSRTVKADNTPYVSSIKAQVSAATSASTICGDTTTNKLTYSVRPKFVFNAQTACYGPPVEVIATVTPAPAFSITPSLTVCNNAVTTLEVTSTLSNYDTYVWSPATNLFTDAAASIPYTGQNLSTVYLKRDTAGVKTYSCNSNNISLCSGLLTTSVTVLPVSPVVTATSGQQCLSGSTSITTSPSTGYGTSTFQWQNSPDNIAFTDIPGATSINYTTPTITATTFYKLQVKIGTTVCSESTDTVAVNNPILLSTTPATRCGTGTVTLGATTTPGSALNWYTAASGGTPVATGTNFTTPIISDTTDYYVSAGSGGGSAYVGKVGIESNASNGGGLTTYVNFTAISDFTLQAVDIFPYGSGAGTVTIELRTSTGTPIMSKVVNVTGGPFTTSSPAQTVDLNFPVTGGASYRLGVNAWTGGVTNLYRDATGTYPYTLPGVVSITGTSLAPYYYFFYNWKVSTGCESLRSLVTATVTPAPAFTISADQTLCSNSLGTLAVTSNLSDYDSYMWSPTTNLYTDASCTLPYTGGSATTLYTTAITGSTIIYNCTAHNSVSDCGNYATSTVTILPTPNLTSTPAELCLSGSSVLTPIPSTGYSAATFQWQESLNDTLFTDIPGANTLTFTTPNITATTYYKLLVKLGTSICNESNATVVVNNPQVLTITPATRCGSGTLSLGATSSPGSTLKWYTDATGGSSIGTGSNYTTSILTTTTNYYVSAENGGGGNGSVGALNNSIGAGGATALTYNLYFDVLAPTMHLTGMYVYPGAAGDVKFYIANSSGTVLQSFTYPVTSGDIGVKTYIPVGFDIPYGTAYRIGYNSTVGGVSLYRNTAGAVYPYTLPGIVSITGNSFSGYPQYYYYFYDWQISSGCASNRTMVTATVTPAADLTISSTQTICRNSVGKLSVTSVLSNFNNYIWSPQNDLYTDSLCTIPYTGSSETTVYVKSATSGTKTYTCTALETITQCGNFKTSDVIVIAVPSLSASPSSLCMSGTSVITSLPATGYSTASFQWKTSSDSSVFADIPAATALNYTTPTINNKTYYRLQVKLDTMVCSESSIGVVVDIPEVTGTTAGERCGSGTVDLAATASSGASLKWYTASTGGSSLGTGTSFTTSTLSNTTTYWVEATTGISGSGDNIGLLATSTHSGGGASPSYGPEIYNNGVIPAYGTTGTGIWGWVTGNGWIEYTWPSPVTFNKVVFYKDTRPMSSCTFQYWDGTAYVNFYSYSNSSVQDSVIFPSVTTTKLRFNTVAGSNPSFREIQVFGGGCASVRTPVIASIFPPTVGGTTNGTQTACYNSIPSDISLSGNVGNVIKWQKSSDISFTSPIDISNTTTTLTGAEIGLISANTYIRAMVQSGSCTDAYSSVSEITIKPAPTALTTVSVGIDNAKVEWTPGFAAADYDMEYGVSPYTFTGTPTKTGIALTSYTITGLNQATTYQYRVRGNCAIGNGTWSSTASFTTDAIPVPGLWTGAVNTNWLVAGNWSDLTVPTSLVDVVIPSAPLNQPHITSALTTPALCNNLTIQSGAVLTIDAGKALTVSGLITNNAGVNGLQMKSDASGTASLIHTTSAVNAKVERYIPHANVEEFHMLASPVAAQAIAPDFNQLDGFYTWSELTSAWIEYADAVNFAAANGGTNFVPGKGYAVSYPAVTTKTFTGSLNQGVMNIPLSFTTGTYQGWNFTANPYPSSVNWDAASGWLRGDLEDAGGSESAMWIWNATTANYGTYISNAGLGTGTNDVTADIPLAQGFWVKAANTGILGMSNDVRSHSSQTFLKSSSTSDRVRLTVTGTANTYSDEIIVKFGNANDLGGAPKLFSIESSAPSLYSTKLNKNWSINYLTNVAQHSVVPVGFKAGVSGDYTIKASDLNSFATPTYVYLKDLASNTITDLNQNSNYTFTASTNDNANRFQLLFALSPLSVSNNTILNTSIYSNNTTIYINSNESIKEIAIYNTLGQLIKTVANTSGTISIEMGENAMAYYIVRVVTTKNVYSEKVLVR
ncbi:MAG: fibronectin type III domain-containing protein [Bacteroidales bacterium]